MTPSTVTVTLDTLEWCVVVWLVPVTPTLVSMETVL